MLSCATGDNFKLRWFKGKTINTCLNPVKLPGFSRQGTMKCFLVYTFMETSNMVQNCLRQAFIGDSCEFLQCSTSLKF